MQKDLVLVLDFGSQYTQLILKKLRKLSVYTIIEHYNISFDKIKDYNPKAIILSGGPSSIYDKKPLMCSKEIFDLPIPLLGICYGMQLINQHFEGRVKLSQQREYGYTEIIKEKSKIFSNIKAKQFNVWMSHGDKIEKIAEQFIVNAKSKNSIAGFEHNSKPIYGLQYHPEVDHSEYGLEVLRNFIDKIAKVKKDWKLPSFIDQQIELIRQQVGSKKIVLGLSGGVDSSVLAHLLHQAIGDNLVCVFVDNGLLRANEPEKIVDTFQNKLKMNLIYVDATEVFLKRLKKVKDPEQKRAIIGKTFIDVFFKHSKRHLDFLAQGTIYPDVIESTSPKGPSDVIKTHHNRVKEVLKLIKKNKVIEPFKELFKDEVRLVGKKLKVPDFLINRHPFPGPGLAIRILGEVTKKRLQILKQADSILLEEIKGKDLYHKFWQCFPVLLPVRSVGVMGDQRRYGYTIALRMVSSNDGMTADFELLPKEILTQISNRIIGEISDITRVTLDITSKPPATIEWE